MLYICIGIAVIILFFIIKNNVWDKPQARIRNLESELKKERENHQREISDLSNRLQNLDDLNMHIVSNEFTDIILKNAWTNILENRTKDYENLDIPNLTTGSTHNVSSVKESMVKRFYGAIDDQYKYRFLTYLYPQLEELFHGNKIKDMMNMDFDDIHFRLGDVIGTVRSLDRKKNISAENILLRSKIRFLECTNSNLTAIPYMAQIMADYETYGLENLAKELDWGYNAERMKKVKSIREIRKDAQSIVEKNKEAEYQLAYLLNMFPNLEDVIETDFAQLPVVNIQDISDYDVVRDYLSKEEYQSLSICERNQLALDRYIASRKKSKWQIGRDYELYVGYKYSQMGFDVNYFGSYMGLEDLGRDLILKKGNEHLIVQCKYWGSNKEIHEKHITQLYGTVICYCIENKLNIDNVKGVIVTNICLSPMAKRMADYLGIRIKEKFEMKEYPRIKCNIGHSDEGSTKIYHLPFDQQYDSAKINKPGEFFALTVEEAENAGFRRAFKWFGSK